MLKRSWVIAVAFGLAATSGAAQDQPASENQPGQEEATTDGQDQGANNQDAATEIMPALEGIESAIRDLIAEEDKVAEEAKESRAKRDISAQEAMAHWAEWMFYAALATVILTALALWAIVRTLHHTRRAADSADGMLNEARATTKAAQDTVDETRRIGEAQTRAYLKLDSATIKHGGISSQFNYRSRSDLFFVIMRVANTGNTPCQWYEISGAVELAERTESGPSVIESHPIKTVRWGALHAGSDASFTLDTGGDEIQRAFIDIMHKPKGMVRVVGVITYETEFREEMKSTFSMFVDRQDIQGAFLLSDHHEIEQLMDWSCKMFRGSTKHAESQH